MTLQYQNYTTTVAEVVDKLKQLTLAYDLKQLKKDTGITLVDGRQKIKGKKAIFEHLRTLEGELHSWYYCDC